MCFQTTCASCKKPTWSGCGKHIDSALASVKLDDRRMRRAGASEGSHVFLSMSDKLCRVG
eukprot:XP_001694449.1 predicted protein [Chlamydomonas reinhardtii]